MAEIFNIDFEAGDLSEFDSTSGTGLSAAEAAAMCGDYGLSVAIDSNTARYGQVGFTQLANASWRFRIYVDPNSMPMDNGDTFNMVNMLDGTAVICFLRLGFDVGDGYYVRGAATSDGGSAPISSKVYITDAPHYVECVVHYSTGPSNNDGRYEILVDGVAQTNVFGLILFNRDGPDGARIGAPAGIDSGTRGTFYLDSIVLRDDATVIGECEAGEPVEGVAGPLAGNIPLKSLVGGGLAR